MEIVDLAFSGPFAWLPGGPVPSLCEVPVGDSQGLYVWTVPTPGGELIYYVGETGRSFARRMQEHLSEQLSGRYRLYEPGVFVQGQKMLLWRGVYGPGSQPDVEGFVAQLPSLAPALVRFVRLMRFHVAPTRCADRLRRRMEAALAHHLHEQKGLVGSFQAEAVRYVPRCPDEEPIVVRLTWHQKPLGVPESLQA